MNISQETLETLAQLICYEALCEREVDFHRQVLVKHQDFVLLNIFNNISSSVEILGGSTEQHVNSITTLDLVGFFKQNGQIISERECYLLVSQYDSNHDGKLSFSDFQLMVTPQDYTLKRNIKNTQKHYQYGLNKPKKLSYDIEVSLVMVFQKIIEGLKVVEQKKQELITAFDWSGLQAFRVIDEYSHGNVNNDNLRVFLRSYDCFANVEEEDLTRLIRKYDKDCDHALSFREFISSLSPKTQYSVKAKDLDKVVVSSNPAIDVKSFSMKENVRPSVGAFSRASKSTTAMSVYRGGPSGVLDAYSQKSMPLVTQDETLFNMRNIDSALDISPKLNLNGSMSNNTVIYKSAGGNTKDEILNYPYLCDQVTPDNQKQELQFADRIKQMSQKNAQLSRQMDVQPKISRESYGDYKVQLIQAFIDMMQVEGNLEKKRRDLAMRQDFNLTDLFKMFNSVKNHRRGVDVDDFYYVLKEYLQLALTKDEVFILFYKLDRDGDGYINYSELTNVFIPNQHEYAVLIQSRKAFHGSHTDPKEYFSKETREFLRRGIRGLVDCEVSIELIKQRVYQKIRLNCENAFHQIDRKGKGMVTMEDLREYLKSGNVFAVEKELQLLFQRMDKDENGVITLPEFVAGISPFMNNKQ